MGFLSRLETHTSRHRYRESSRQVPILFGIFLFLLFPHLSSAINLIDFPTDHQLYQRDAATNVATIPVQGIIEKREGYTSINLKVYRGNTLFEQERNRLRFASNRAYFDLSINLPAELSNFRFELYGIQDGEEILLKKAEKVVAGDIILINGQSNAEAYASAKPADLDEFARSYTTEFSWNYMQYSYPGQWGGRLAKNSITQLGVPVAIFNEAEGGKDIAYFLKNTTNSTLGNYGKLKNRLVAAGVKKVTSIVWFQGEGDGWTTTIEAYKDRFKQLHAAWVQDYQPQFTYIYQIRYGSCSHTMPYPMEAQRQLAIELPNVGIMSSTNVDHDGCHFYYENGYRELADNLFQLMRKNRYGGSIGEVEAPHISKATLLSSTEIVLEFDNTTALFKTGNPWSDFRVEGSAVSVQTGRIEGNRLILSLSGRVNRVEGISYLAHIGSAKDWLFNANQIGMLTFYNYPVEQDGTIATSMETEGNPAREQVDCNGIGVATDNNSLTLSGLVAPIVTVQVFNDQWELIYRCAGDCPTTTKTIEGLRAGAYYVKIQLLQADWQLICFLENTYRIGGTVSSPSIGICDNIGITVTATGISISGLDGAAVASVLVFTLNYSQQLYHCWGPECGEEATILIPFNEGDYRVVVKYYDAAFEQICQKEELVTIGSGLDESSIFSYRKAKVAATTTDLLAPTLEIYPTIVKDHLYINIPNHQKLVTSLEIWSQYGQRMQRINAKDWHINQPIYVDNLAKGIYFLNAPLKDGSNLTRIFIIP